MVSVRDFSLSCAMLPMADFKTLVKCANEAGFGYLTLRPIIYQRTREAGLSDKDMRDILAEHNIAISELDPFCAWMEGVVKPDNIAAPFFQTSEAEFLDTAKALGARNVNVIFAFNEALEVERTSEALRALSERAAAQDVLISLEFMPWSSVPDFSTALDIAERVNHPNFGVNIDFWHHARSGGTLADFEELDANHIAAVQLSDVLETPLDNIILETATARQWPGNGQGLAVDKLKILKTKGVDAPITVEVFNPEVFGLPPHELSRKLTACAEHIITQMMGET